MEKNKVPRRVGCPFQDGSSPGEAGLRLSSEGRTNLRSHLLAKIHYPRSKQNTVMLCFVEVGGDDT